MPTSGLTHAWFDSTSWSLILRAQHDPGDLEKLLRAYWSPVYAYIRRKGFSTHDASDITQDFLTQVVLGRDFLGRADQGRGSFRAFVKASLRNFLIDHQRRSRRRRSEVSIEEAALPPAVSEKTELGRDETAPSEAFDRQWAAAVLAVTVERLRAGCEADDMTPHWRAFDMNVLRPITRGATPLPMDEVARLVGARDAAHASNMIVSVKRRFRATLRKVVAETVSDPAQIEQEIQLMKRVTRL
jgi:RNA polymerase sigma-70 factor (ECF subfamily)